MSKPNILIIMSDQHSAAWSGPYGHPFLRTPALDRLAAEGATFENAYCNSPICAPSRASFMTGKLCSDIEVWDVGTPLGSDQPTWAHYLNAAGYETTLSGKMHFVGPDQMHGFGRRLLSDVHGDGNPQRTPDWEDWDPSRASMDRSDYDDAGPGDTTYQQYDDEVARRAVAYLREPARREKPWALCASFMTPHKPFTVRRRYWDEYYPEHADQPGIPAHGDTVHPYSRRIGEWFDFHDIEPEKTARVRAAYYGLVTFCDERIGEILDALDASGEAENTLVVYVSDHGELNGEHGLWSCHNFYEHSSRVPMIVRWPGVLEAGRRVRQVVSMVDLTATLLDAAGVTDAPSLAGESLLPVMRGERPEIEGSAISAYFAEGSVAPARMLRRGRYKLNFYYGERPELFDLEEDPDELNDLAGSPEHADLQARLMEELLADWDPEEIDRRVRASQRRRLLRHAGDPGSFAPVWEPGRD